MHRRSTKVGNPPTWPRRPAAARSAAVQHRQGLEERCWARLQRPPVMPTKASSMSLLSIIRYRPGFNAILNFDLCVSDGVVSPTAGYGMWVAARRLARSRQATLVSVGECDGRRPDVTMGRGFSTGPAPALLRTAAPSVDPVPWLKRGLRRGQLHRLTRNDAERVPRARNQK